MSGAIRPKPIATKESVPSKESVPLPFKGSPADLRNFKPCRMKPIPEERLLASSLLVAKFRKNKISPPH
jgi:hypothetical protein